MHVVVLNVGANFTIRGVEKHDTQIIYSHIYIYIIVAYMYYG